jgi:hypothetical protein
MESLIKKAAEIELEDEEKEALIELLANHMKKSYVSWNKDGVEDDKILQDLNELSKGKLNFTSEDMKLVEVKIATPQKQKKKKYKKK